MGLTISAWKAKIMAVGEQLQEKFSYNWQMSLLTLWLSTWEALSCQTSTVGWTGKASNSFRCLSRILWYQQKIQMRIQLGMFKVIAVLPTLLP